MKKAQVRPFGDTSKDSVIRDKATCKMMVDILALLYGEYYSSKTAASFKYWQCNFSLFRIVSNYSIVSYNQFLCTCTCFSQSSILLSESKTSSSLWTPMLKVSQLFLLSVSCATFWCQNFSWVNLFKGLGKESNLLNWQMSALLVGHSWLLYIQIWKLSNKHNLFCCICVCSLQ